MEKKSSEKKPLDINEFYKIIYKSRDSRKRILKNILSGKKPLEKDIFVLEDSLNKLKNIKKEKKGFILIYKEDKIISKLKYEIEELEKDLIYLKKGEKKLLNYLSELNKNFQKETDSGIKYLEKKSFDTFITDRDGTINNYSERYLSSVQSVYNAVFLSRFISEISNPPIIITSGPLNEFNKINIMPHKNIIYAGSKGREVYFNKKTFRLELSKKEKKLFSELIKLFEALSKKPEYSKFFLKGSGFQKKLGELSISRQDFLNSIPEKESEDFLDLIKEIVHNVDKEGLLSVSDTGLDIEITLKKNSGEFNKSHGLNFVLKKTGIIPGKTLVCGDTFSDIKLLESISKKTKNFDVIFCTLDKKLKSQIKKIKKDALFVSNPDVLITILNRISKK
ncbi:MAG: hypothetical protein ACOC1P_06485 [Minisyncoccales bacterium]